MVEFPTDVLRLIVSFLKPKRIDGSQCSDTVPVLRSMLRAISVKVGGTKTALVNRLLANQQWARRPFWDSASNALLLGIGSAATPARLTFQTCLHNAANWEAKCRDITCAAAALFRTTQPVDEATQTLFSAYYLLCADVTRMYSRYTRFISAQSKKSTITSSERSRILRNSFQIPLSNEYFCIYAPPGTWLNARQRLNTLYITLRPTGIRKSGLPQAEILTLTGLPRPRRRSICVTRFLRVSINIGLAWG